MQNISDQHMLMKKLIKVILSAQCSHLSGIWERWLVGSLPPILERLIPGLEPTTHHLDKGNLPSHQVKFIHELLSNKFPGYRTSKSIHFCNRFVEMSWQMRKIIWHAMVAVKVSQWNANFYLSIGSKGMISIL